MTKKSVMSLTDNAVNRIKELLAQRGKESLGIRVGIRSGGCSGFKYVVEYADKKQDFDEIVEQDGLIVLIDPKALIYLINTEMDFIVEQFKSGFTFTNPNEKGQCGCGKSFSV